MRIRIVQQLAAAAALAAASAHADVPIPPTPAGHPRILAPELQRFRNDLAAQRPAIKRFKEQVVDAEIAGEDIYLYAPWYSAFMGAITGQAKYCNHAVQLTDAFLDAEALLIRSGEVPDARSDSYLQLGEDVGNVALVFDWCYANLTPTQKLRWGNYADRFTDNVWHQDTNHWGEATAANNWSWEGIPREAGSGWSVDNPVNNYYYSFLEATMLWGLASRNEPGRTAAEGFLQKFRNEKVGNQLVPVFNAQVRGGGSREGTGYGTAMGRLFKLYWFWERTTGERIADLTPHTQESMPYWLHAISPSRDFLAPIGDHSRDSTAAFYDYHRALLLSLASLYRGTPMARSVRDFLAASPLPLSGDQFNWINDVLYDETESASPASLGTAYFATGTGHFFTRASWNPNATWLSFLTGAYTESHAHPDGLSILLFKNGWLVNDENMESHSGLVQEQLAHALVRQQRASDGSELPMYSYEAEGQRPESAAHVRAMAVRPAYTYVASDSGTLFVHPDQGDQGVRASRELVFIKPDVVVVFDRSEYTLGASIKTFQLPTPGRPSVAGRTATYSNGSSTLTVHALSPVNSTLAVTDMTTLDPDFEGGFRIDATVSSSGPTRFFHVLSVDGAVSAAVRGANDGAATLTLADGRHVTLAFNLTGSGGTIEIRDAANQVLASETLPTTVAAPPVLDLPPCTPGDDDGDGMPNCVERDEGRNAAVKDNDVFGNSRLFAMQQYRDFLGREGDASGIQFYVDLLGAGTATRGQVIENFLASPEFQNGLPQVTRLYFSFFNRIPDYGGLLFQVGAFRSGTPLEAIAQNFYNSPEFTNRYGALGNDDYINLVYQNVLGRAPDPGGFAYYKNLLDTNAITKGQMMIGFSESPEFQQLIGDEVYVTSVYVGMLRRAPDASGLQFYVDQITGGLPRNSIIANFFNAPEYHNRFLP